MKHRSLITLVSILYTTLAMAQMHVTEAKGDFAIVSPQGTTTLVYDRADDPVVGTVSACVAEDIQLVTGQKPALQTSLSGTARPIVAGTIGRSPLLDGLIAQGRVDTTGVTGVWEAYKLQLVDAPCDGVEQALVVMGGTPRGTAYGLFEISRMMGVSPYVWWADVMPEPRSALYVNGTKTEVESPDVKYRGLFINDEDWGLLPWARKGIDKSINNIGPNTYRRVFELLLRLRANCLWPAKHGSSKAFWSSEDNKKLAKLWCIVMSSGDSMLRDNLWEWPRFKSGNNSGNFSFAYNPEGCADYWAKRAGEARDYEGIYDIGMRGLQDVALLGYEGQAAQLAGLKDIIACQRQIITDSLGGDPTKVPQIYIPYKEALTLYNAGLKIPDDVTLCWVDDNYAFIRQLPTAAEQKRSGGNGIYYHLSYLGNPSSYLWLSTISPSLISYELTKGYENGMQRFWMVNVGDIKPAEVEFEFCMELAWNVESWAPEKAWQFSRWWAAKTFGEDLADALADIRLEYYRLAAQSKPENIFYPTFTVPEMEQRLRDYDALETRLKAIKGSVPERLQDAFYELMEFPVVGCADMNRKVLGAKLSYIYANAGNRDKSLMYGSMSRRGYQEIVNMTDYFNNTLANGKWNGIMPLSHNGDGVYKMPGVAGIADVCEWQGDVVKPQQTILHATEHTGSRGEWAKIANLGVDGDAMTVWPINYKTFTATTARSGAPYLEFTTPLEKGTYDITVRCLPTFPITTSNDLQVGFGVASGTPTAVSIKVDAETNVWSDNVMRGYAEARFTYKVTGARDYALRFYAMNPGLVISQIVLEPRDTEDLALTNELLVNPDFELYKSGSSVLTNTSGGIQRGVPYGWTVQGKLNGNSYGINIDGSRTYNDGNICWFKSSPMPADFELYQTVPAAKLTPGIYEVGCLLWNQSGRRGTCRLFAGNQVQYYGNANDYAGILTEGEHSSFAGYQAGNPSNATLHPMRVYVAVHEGEDLRLGIRSSNMAPDGAQTNETGWFKVDHFTIHRIGDIPQTDADSLTKALIANYDFELDVDGNPIAKGATSKGVPFGWTMESATTFPGTNYGIFPDKSNGSHAASYCAFMPSSTRPMPREFTLSQTLPAEKLQPGTYRVSCRLWNESGKEGTCRLFANDQVQYFATDMDYAANQTEGEQATFGNYIGTLNTAKQMQEVFVYVAVKEGEDLTLGIRTSNCKGTGAYASGSDATGSFMVDYFRIERVSDDITAIQRPHAPSDASKSLHIYDLQGRMVGTEIGKLPRGIYVQNGRKVLIK